MHAHILAMYITIAVFLSFDIHCCLLCAAHTLVQWHMQCCVFVSHVLYIIVFNRSVFLPHAYMQYLQQSIGSESPTVHRLQLLFNGIRVLQQLSTTGLAVQECTDS